MVRYSSRVGKTKRVVAAKPRSKNPTKAGKSKVLQELKQKEPSSIGGAAGSVLGIDTGGELIPASLENVSVGGSLRTGGGVSTGGSLRTGGGVSTGGSVSSGGSLETGGAFEKAKNMVQNMQHPDMINILQHMSLPEFGLLQGIAGSSIGNAIHPMKGLIRKHLGGKFEHPKGVSRVATKDILKGNQQDLMRALHDEFLDMKAGRRVGGGLLSSLKHHFIRGLRGLNSKLGSGIAIARKFEKILSLASKFAQDVSPSLQTAFPAQSGLIKGAVSGLSAIEKGVKKGIKISEGAKGVGEIASGVIAAAEADK